MVRDHQAVDARLGGADRVIRPHDAFQDQRARPDLAELLDVAPRQRRADLLRDEGADLLRVRARLEIGRPVRQRRASVAGVVLEPVRPAQRIELGGE